MSAADNTYNAESIHTELSDDNNQTVKEGSSKSEVTQQPTDSAVGLQDSIIFTVDKDASKDNILTSTASSELVSCHLLLCKLAESNNKFNPTKR